MMEDDETDLREQIFHNNVREQIVSNLVFMFLLNITFVNLITIVC